MKAILPDDQPVLTGIFIYPVKGCRGVRLTESAVDDCGLVGDRRWMIVDEQGMFLSQRGLPGMALIETRLEKEGALVLAKAGFGEMRVGSGAEEPEQKMVTVWRDALTVMDVGDEAAGWLSEVLGIKCRLVRMNTQTHRVVPAARVVPGLGAKEQLVSFADAFPFLLISEASLAELNSRLDEPLPMDRFRPNLVVSGLGAFEEDRLGRFQIGEVIFHAASPCGRCVVTTTNQQTAERGQEPLRTLAQYRRDGRGEVNFGQNLLHETKHGSLRVGDVLRRDW